MQNETLKLIKLSMNCIGLDFSDFKDLVQFLATRTRLNLTKPEQSAIEAVLEYLKDK